MKRTAVKLIAFMFAMLIAFSGVSVIGVLAAEPVNDAAEVAGESAVAEGNSVIEENVETEPEQGEEIKLNPAIEVAASGMELVVRRKMQMTAELTDIPEGTPIVWKSSDTEVAEVDGNGLVKGIAVGRAVISATAVVNGEEITGGYAIHVVTRSNIIKNLLVSKQVLSYKYSYTDDYYYTNDKKCWQSNFGFNKYYDIVAPYVLLEYDYVRVHFTYEEKDWMVQLWKGQYGLLFYGSEIGIYTKKHSDKKDRLFTTYACASQEDWLKMEMTLYHDKLLNGNYEREFTRDYGDYWWCTGFKDGHLLVEEPAKELRMTSRITFKDEEMTRLFVEGLKECGFRQTSLRSLDELPIDRFCVDGNDVYFKWQDINDAENTMPIKITAGVLFFVNLFAIILAILAIFGMAGLFIIII